MIRQIKRIRPNFANEDTLIGNRTGEFCYIPEELVPHTVVASLPEKFKCELLFEYPFDELADKPQILGMGITYIVGKYTNKVIKIILEFNSYNDLITKAGVAAELLNGKKYMLTKPSHRKNYEMASGVLETFALNISQDPNIESLIGR